jgi:hypothetical protein
VIVSCHACLVLAMSMLTPVLSMWLSFSSIPLPQPVASAPPTSGWLGSCVPSGPSAAPSLSLSQPPNASKMLGLSLAAASSLRQLRPHHREGRRR